MGTEERGWSQWEKEKEAASKHSPFASEEFVESTRRDPYHG